MPSDRPSPAPATRALRAGRRAPRFLLCLATVLAALPGPLRAQVDEGTWWAVTVGAGSARFTCDLCAVGRDSGPWIGVAVGASASEAVRVGVEGGSWTHLDDGIREWVHRAGVVAHVYPRVGSGLHLIGGAGWAAYRAGEFRYDSGRLTVGVGWDLPLAPGWSVGNALTLDASSFGSLKNGETTLDRDVGVSVVRLGVFLKHR